MRLLIPILNQEVLLTDFLKYFHVCVLSFIFTAPTWSGPHRLSRTIIHVSWLLFYHQSCALSHLCSTHLRIDHASHLLSVWALAGSWGPSWCEPSLLSSLILPPPWLSAVLCEMAPTPPFLYSFICITLTHFVRHLKHPWKALLKLPGSWKSCNILCMLLLLHWHLWYLFLYAYLLTGP